MRIKAFNAWRAAPGAADRVASPPYDVVDRASARAIADGNPMCFLHVSRADIDLPDDTDPCDPRVYTASAAAFQRFRAEGWLRQDAEPGLYAYRLATAAHAQTGLVAVVHADDYEAGVIRRHEFTRPGPEADRTRHIEALQAQAGPLLLAFRDDARVTTLISEAASGVPLFDFVAPDGLRHTGWRLPDTRAAVAAFCSVPAAYIADGHHRAAGAARVARERRAARPQPAGEMESDWMMAVLFPASELRILPYNRCLRDLGGLAPCDLLDRIGQAFEIKPDADPSPNRPGVISLYLEGRWYGLHARQPPPPGDPVARLDASLLQDRILAPVLGIRDPRRDERLFFLGGAEGAPEALAQRVDQGDAAAAFSLPPVSMEDLMSISDAQRTLPPKSTWFEPKLRSGLFVHSIEG